MTKFKCVQLKKGNIPDNKFNKAQLKIGARVEHEHTDDNSIAKQIAKAHLSEDKNYYTKLKKAKL